MTELNYPYPPTPENVDKKVTNPSVDFKREVSRVMGSILLFILVYILLVIAAVVLACLAGYGGIALITVFPKLITVVIGIGMIGLGIMVLFYLIKFIFKTNTVDRSGLIEIKKQDQPELFAFIGKLTREIKAPFPKKIYLSADENACVFYDSSFWSMFLTVRKNLQIGLGLVNSVNMSEFKAILAHEFGHFSQRSMKLGSYVYNVNRVIYNLLYDNDDYVKALDSWSSVSSYFHFFASLTVGIVQLIQRILQSMYGLINRNYMSLSRQMEYHADAVAASVSGSEHLITSLRRLELADNSYQRLFGYLNTWVGENIKARNIYPHHKEIMKYYASEFSIPIINELPLVTAQSFRAISQSRIVIKDQWASHPTTEDREEHLRRLNIQTEVMPHSAWHIFRNADKVQEKMTEMIYETTQFKSAPVLIDTEMFNEKYLLEVGRYKLNSVYRGIYDFRKVSELNLDELNNSTYKSLNEIISDEVQSLPQKIDSIRAEIEVLQSIKLSSSPVNTFEFEGAKYSKNDADSIIKVLNDELNEAEKKLSEVDRNLITLVTNVAVKAGKGDEIKDRYKNLFKLQNEVEEDYSHYMDIANVVQPAYQSQVSIEQAIDIDNKIRIKESTIKERIRKVLTDPASNALLTDEQKNKLTIYTKENLYYFSKSSGFNNEALDLLNYAMNTYYGVVVDQCFTFKKDLFDWQTQFISQ